MVDLFSEKIKFLSSPACKETFVFKYISAFSAFLFYAHVLEALICLSDALFPSVSQFNFVGKLLGPRGNSMKRLQEETGVKMSILGKGSMRDKGKVRHRLIFVEIFVFIYFLTSFYRKNTDLWFSLKAQWNILNSIICPVTDITVKN